jgi:hypothetical protein
MIFEGRDNLLVEQVAGLLYAGTWLDAVRLIALLSKRALCCLVSRPAPIE